jgi:hypothetical protein
MRWQNLALALSSLVRLPSTTFAQVGAKEEGVRPTQTR